MKSAIKHCEEARARYQNGDLEAAATQYKQALELEPRIPDAWADLGFIRYQLQRYAEAEEALNTALTLKPGHPQAMNNLANLYQRTNRLAEAEALCRTLTAAHPDYLNAWMNLGTTLRELGRDAESAEAYRRALALKPDHAPALAELLYRLRTLCDWGECEDLQTRLTQAIHGGNSAPPFATALFTDAETQHLNARAWSAANYPKVQERPSMHANERIRIGYLSSDFYDHATAYLISELFEHHDRTQFEIFAYSAGKPKDCPERSRITAAADQFRDIYNISDRDAADLIRADSIDILVDLKGYTKHHRMGVMALKPVPVQMHYLGYPSTTGAPFIDYFISDNICTPENTENHFSERLIRLPHSYQINDRKRPLPAPTPRAAQGLPETGFVFAAFNAPYKITPEIFAAWMRLLNATESSVLWLMDSHATENLTREASAHGIASERLVFAKQTNLAEHLSRYHHADLFLDTAPVSGHTTASDALWCGVPVVALLGETFAGRVAASLLHAVELPQLVTESLDAYEALALSLAHDSEKRDALKHHLTENRMRFPLFDSEATTRALEAAYLHALNHDYAGAMRKQ